MELKEGLAVLVGERVTLVDRVSVAAPVEVMVWVTQPVPLALQEAVGEGVGDKVPPERVELGVGVKGAVAVPPP